jgi:Sap, sulfolipid-1-addressing protein
MGSVILLSLTASLNPTLVAATTTMLLLPSPKRLMLGYLTGAMLVSVSLGLLIVFSFPHSSVTSTTRRTLSPAADIWLGLVALLIAFVLHGERFVRLSERRHRRRESKPAKGPPRWQRELSKGSPRLTFVVGILLTLPGASYLLGLSRIRSLHYSTAASVVIIVGFNIVMLWILEAPLASFLLAPEWTPQAVERAKAWVGHHWRVFAVRGFSIVGVLLIIKGVVGLL